MFEITLIEMPFADIGVASLGLTRLKYVVDHAYSARVRTRILYLNHAFAAYLGVDLYQEIALGLQHLHSGLGDWLFSQVAFPEMQDNTEEYFRRYYPDHVSSSHALRHTISGKRAGIDQFFEDLILKYELSNSQLIGFSSMFSQNAACFAFARKLKTKNPSLIIVMGGANCEHPMGKEIIHNVQAIDYVFSGSALVSFPAFVGLQLSGSLDSACKIAGVLAKNKGSFNGSDPDLTTIGDINTSNPFGEELDINTVIPLEFGDFLDGYKRLTGSAVAPTLPFETSRGCWWGEKAHCTFCGLSEMRSRVMQPRLAIEQFRSLFAYSSRCRCLSGIDNILPKNYITEVLPYLDTPSNMHIFYEAKADLSEQDFSSLAKARVTKIQPGIEALASSTLKLMKKGTTAFQNVSLLKNCVLHDIEPTWNLLVGFPGEKEYPYEKYCRDIPLLVHLPPPSGIYPIRFDRYSPYFDDPHSYGLDLRPLDSYGMIYPFPEESLRNFAYYFLDHNFEAPYFIELVKWIRPLQKAVESWRMAWRQGRRGSCPRLEFADNNGQASILDSRSGTLVMHPVTEYGARILERLNSPASLDRIAAEFGSLPGSELENEITKLNNRGFVFEEGGRFLSLVLPRARLALSSAQKI